MVKLHSHRTSPKEGLSVEGQPPASQVNRFEQVYGDQGSVNEVPDRLTNTRQWKHYFSATPLMGGNNPLDQAEADFA